MDMKCHTVERPGCDLAMSLIERLNSLKSLYLSKRVYLVNEPLRYLIGWSIEFCREDRPEKLSWHSWFHRPSNWILSIERELHVRPVDRIWPI
jgi:hypothetical protein